MVNFSELKNKPVIDEEGVKVGVLQDLVFIDGEEYAEISHLVYLSEDKYRKKISWRFVKELKTKEGEGITIHLNESIREINLAFEQEREFLVGNLIDKQIVDVHGLKVVRVNDVLLGKLNSKFCIVAVGVGTKSLVRRLGIESLVDVFVPQIKEHIIPWQSVEPLEEGLHKLHIKHQKSKIADLHPSDIADIMEDLTHKERVLIFNSLDKEKAAKTFVEAEPNVQSSFFKNLKINHITEILETISPNHAADILSMMPKTRADELLNSMHQEYARKIREVLKYPEKTAGALMHTKLIAIPKDYTAQKTINLLRKLKPSSEETYHLYVVDKANHLLGVLSIRALLTAPCDMVVSKFMRKEVVKIKIDAGKDEIANAITKYNIFVLPVVDKDNVLQGILKADDVLTEVMPKSWKKKVFMIKKTKHKK